MLYENRERAGSFGADAEAYDAVRPRYPSAVVDALLANGAHTVLDVGCGTGIAGSAFAARGCDVLGIEPDPRMAALALERGLRVEVGHFEEWDAAGRIFDLVICAQAWHWIEPKAGIAKIVEVLRPGGTFAAMWNFGEQVGPLREAFRSIYRSHAPELEALSVTLGHGDNRVEKLVSSLDATGGFSTTVERFPWERTYRRDEWLENLATHSDHRTLDPDVRVGLLAAIGDAIDRAGGVVEIAYSCDVVRSRRTG